MIFLRKVFLIALLACLLISACKSDTPSTPKVSQPQLPESQPEPQEPEPTDQPEPTIEPEPLEEPATTEEPSESAFLSCPTSGETLTLGFDHAITIEQAGVNLTHILKEGFLLLIPGEADADGTVSLSSTTPQPLSYEMLGIMGDCSVEMSGMMDVSATGTCTDGVVYLTIEETWHSASGVMTCDNNTIPFNTPESQTYIHEGPDGSGEVFYLVADSAGYTVMREFGMGSGYHSWTLYASTIDLVPLVP